MAKKNLCKIESNKNSIEKLAGVNYQLCHVHLKSQTKNSKKSVFYSQYQPFITSKVVKQASAVTQLEANPIHSVSHTPKTRPLEMRRDFRCWLPSERIFTSEKDRRWQKCRKSCGSFGNRNRSGRNISHRIVETRNRVWEKSNKAIQLNLIIIKWR